MAAPKRQIGEDFADGGRQRSSDPVYADGHRARGAAHAGGAKFDFGIHADGAEQVAGH